MTRTLPLLLGVLLLTGCSSGPSDTAWKNCVNTLSFSTQMSASEMTTEEYADELVEVAEQCQGWYDTDPGLFEQEWGD